MANFMPVSPPVYVYNGTGQKDTVIGWYSADHWGHIHPVVKNPDGPGAGPWRDYYGEDPWFLS
jgi:hypothetical protein